MHFNRTLFLFIILLNLCSCGSESWFGSDKKLNMPGERIPLIVKNINSSISNDKYSLTLPYVNNNSNWNGHYNQFDSKDANLNWNENITSHKINYSDSTNLIQPSLPIIDKNEIFLMSNKGVVTAYKNGDKIWENNYFNLSNKTGFISFSEDKFLSGGLYKYNQVIYTTSGLPMVVAIDSLTGENIWVTEFSSPIRSIPLIVNTSLQENNLVVVQSIDNKLYALDAKTGNIVWSYISTSEDLNSLSISSPKSIGNLIISKFSNDEIVALNKTNGQEVWSNNLTFLQSNLVNRSSVSNNNFFTGDNFIISQNSDGNVFKIDIHTGLTIWSKDLLATSKSWLVGNSYFFVNTNNDIVHLNAKDGNIIWSTNLNPENADKKLILDYYLSNPIMVNNNVFIANNKGELITLSSKNGNTIKKYKISDNVFLSPIFSDSKMFIISNFGYLDIY